jgi:hypothetical protein
MKLDSTRINQTIAFIDNNNNFSMLRRQAVAQFCRQTYPKLSAFDFGQYRGEFEALSSAMSVKQQATVPAGNEDDRAKRRAIFLIWKSIDKALTAGTVPSAQAAMTMPTGNLDAALADAVLKASVVAGAATGGDVFTNEVVAHPARFLRTHKVIVLGVTTGAGKFSNLAGADYTNALTFYFQYDPGNDRFVFNGVLNAAYGAGHPFQTVSVPAVNWYDVPGNGGEHAPLVPANFSQILGCELTGANFMVTTQFTGCTFCWTNHGGVVRASHIGPTRAGFPNAALATSYPGGGNGVAQRMITQGNPAPGGIGVAAGMANAPGVAMRVFGRGAGNAPAIGGGNSFYPNATLRYATIIGRNVGGWRFYLQAIDSVTNAISEARRIY